jgi:Tfp pilus assembly protein PilF
MKLIARTTTLFAFFTIVCVNAQAQLPQTKIDNNGELRTVESGMLVVPPQSKYNKLIDSLDKNLKLNPADTISLFYRALIYYSYNQMLAQPAQRTKGTLEELTLAKDMIEKAINLKMKDFRATLLRAQIYNELCYRFSGDESWMFNTVEVAKRRKQFESYKEKTNHSYEEIIKADKNKEYLYKNKMITYSYPIK